MTEKRFDYVMNEFDEIEYITDIVDCEDRDFAEFLDCVNEMAKENEQLKSELKMLQSQLHRATIDSRLRTLKELKKTIEKMERME